MKKKIITGVCGCAVAAMLLSGCGSDGASEANTSSNTESMASVENGTGKATNVSLNGAYYHDVLETSQGDLYILTDGEAEDSDESGIIWKSTDRGETWEAAFEQPAEVSQDAYPIAGVLHENESGVEAFVVISDTAEDDENATQNRLFQITQKNTVELETGDVFEQLDGNVWDVAVVNDHVLSFAGSEQCVLYDTDAQSVVKSLDYDYYSAGMLSMKDQFIIYGDEIKYCLDADTLEDTEPSENLSAFIKNMWEKNDSEVFPPMDSYDDAIICMTSDAVYEFRDDREVNVISIPDTVHGGACFNGMFPVCKGSQNTYYLSTFSASETTLWRLEPSEENETEDFTIYSLESNEAISQIAMLYQQEHPEINVKLQVGMEDEAALTRTDAIKQLNTELMSGEGPDIIVMDGLSVDRYIDMDLISPVNIELSDEEYFSNIVNTYKRDGELYAVPTDFLLYAVQGNADFDSLFASSEALGEWLLENAKQTGMSGYEYTKDYDVYAQYVQFLYDVYAKNMIRDEKADAGVLTSYLELCGKLAEQSETTLSDQESSGVSSILPGEVEIHYNDSVQVSAGLVAGITDLGGLTTQEHDGESDYGLYPMYQPSNVLAINANTKQSDTAESFIEFALSDKAQELNMNAYQPVKLDTFQSAVRGEGMDVDADGLVCELVMGEELDSFLIYAPTENENDELEQQIKEMKTVYTEDAVLREIVMNAAKEYLDGQQSLNDAVSSAVNRINLYRGE